MTLDNNIDIFISIANHFIEEMNPHPCKGYRCHLCVIIRETEELIAVLGGYKGVEAAEKIKK